MDDGRMERIERRVDDLDQRASSMERAMETVMERSRAAMGVMVPAETRQHLRAAWRENLLAMRSMLDHWAERLEEDSKSSSSGGASDTARDSGRENIPID